MSTTKKTKNTTQETGLKPCSAKELAGRYGVSTKTLRTWLEPHSEKLGKRKSRLFTTLQLSIIYEALGAPDDG